MPRKKQGGVTASERVQSILGGDPVVLGRALEAWSRCLEEAMGELEKKFSKDEWTLMGEAYSSSEVSVLPTALPPTVVIEHLVLDFCSGSSTKDGGVLGKQLGPKLKRLTTVEGYALESVLRSFGENGKALRNKNWWSLAERKSALGPYNVVNS